VPLGSFISHDLPELLDLLYGAAVDRELWPSFLQALVKPFDGANGILHFFDIQTQSTPVAYNFGIETSYLSSYQEYFSNHNPYPIQSFCQLPVLEVRPATDILDREIALRSEFYNDWMRPQGITPDHLGCMIHNDGKEMALLAIAPSAKNLDRKFKIYSEKFKILAPHLKRAIALSKTGRAAADHDSMLARFVYPAMLLSPEYVVRAVNTAAEELLKLGTLLKVDHRGKVRVSTAPGQLSLAAALEAVFKKKLAVFGPACIQDPREQLSPYLLALRLSKMGEETALILLLPDLPGRDAFERAGFTAAEARLARALASGMDLKAYSESVGIAITTARNQLSALFAKTGTHRQGALVAWLLRRMPFV
jgi:DNA-binding CsgD family transcriptional regulator